MDALSLWRKPDASILGPAKRQVEVAKLCTCTLGLGLLLLRQPPWTCLGSELPLDHLRGLLDLDQLSSNCTTGSGHEAACAD